MSVTHRITARSCWDAGMKTGRMRRRKKSRNLTVAIASGKSNRLFLKSRTREQLTAVLENSDARVREPCPHEAAGEIEYEIVLKMKLGKIGIPRCASGFQTKSFCQLPIANCQLLTRSFVES